MQGHAHFRIMRGDARDQLGRAGVARNDDGAAGLAFAQSLFALGEGDAGRLFHPAMAGDALAVENRPYVAVEIHGRWLAPARPRQEHERTANQQHTRQKRTGEFGSPPQRRGPVLFFDRISEAPAGSSKGQRGLTAPPTHMR